MLTISIVYVDVGGKPIHVHLNKGEIVIEKSLGELTHAELKQELPLDGSAVGSCHRMPEALAIGLCLLKSLTFKSFQNETESQNVNAPSCSPPLQDMLISCPPCQSERATVSMYVSMLRTC
jgi:hypothetical protein